MSEKRKMLRALIDGKIPPPPIAKFFNMQFLGFEDGRARMELSVDEKYHNPMGTLHGGVYVDLADAAMGVAFFTTLADDEIYTTVDLRISFLKSVVEGTITASAEVIHRGHRIGYVECDINNEGGELVARASCTCLVLSS